MSKPIAKVTFSVLIALALIVGIYSSVQGAISSAGTRSGQVHVDAGLNADLSHVRSSPAEKIQSVLPQGESVDRPHGCHSDEFTGNPDDY